jgi:hypothetical protein
VFISQSEPVGVALMRYRVHRDDLASAAELLTDGLLGTCHDAIVIARHGYDRDDRQIPLGEVDLSKVIKLVVSSDKGSLMYERSVDEPRPCCGTSPVAPSGWKPAGPHESVRAPPGGRRTWPRAISFGLAPVILGARC